MNTLLATGEEQMTETWLRWRKFVEQTPDLPIGQVIRGGTVCGDKIAPEVIAGYEAPFPNKSYKAGAVTWPLLLPLQPDDPGASEMLKARTVLSKWRKPVLAMFSDSDPYTRGFDTYFCRLIPTAKERKETLIFSRPRRLRGSEEYSRLSP
jgi:haloalkane dehalogenase